MSPWAPIAVAGVLSLLNIASGFYGRLIPAESQKLHLRRLGFWVIVIYDCAAATFFILSLFRILRAHAPLTQKIVFAIAADVAGLTIIVLALLFYEMSRMLNRVVRMLDKHLTLIEANIEYSEANRRALLLLAPMSSQGTPEQLTTVLTQNTGTPK
ncbi:MAG: hypothetical protein ABI076_05850 [Acidobacteriaceae bacterium]